MITNTPENFSELQKRQLDIFTRKNKDYGNSYEQSLEEDGLLVAKIRLGDKYSRFKTLLKAEVSEVNDESLEDTLLDLANYAMMTVLYMNKNLTR